MDIKIPEGFFKGEIREGFYVESMMKKNWACMIKMLAEVDRICKKHNIQYFADWGTLLGTVRHHGFVPWDDDVDITMKRPDFNKFCLVAPKELPEGWEIVNIHNDVNWRHMLAHVVTGRSVNYDPEHLKEFYGFPYVPGIDIFPLDYLAPTEEEDADVCKLVNIVGVTAASYDNSENSEDSEEEKMATIKAIEEMCGVKFDYSKDIVNQLLRLQERLSMMYSEEEATKIALMPDHAGPRPTDVYPKEYYAGTIEMPFEYITLPVPVGYENILAQKYGPNWRTPYLGGGSHDYPYYKKQQKIVWEALGVL